MVQGLYFMVILHFILFVFFISRPMAVHRNSHKDTCFRVLKATPKKIIWVCQILLCSQCQSQGVNTLEVIRPINYNAHMVCTHHSDQTLNITDNSYNFLKTKNPKSVLLFRILSHFLKHVFG